MLRLTLLIVLGLGCPSIFGQENVVIILDDSGSMKTPMSSGSSRIEAAKSAITSVLKQFPRDTKLGLLLLNGARNKDHWAIPPNPLSVSQATSLVAAIRAEGGTPLGDKMREGADALLKLREKQVYGNYRLIIVSDGEAEDKKLLESYLPDILSRGIMVNVIGVDMKKDHSLATRVHSYRRADDQAALEKAIEEVLAERIDASGGNQNSDYETLEGLDDQLAKDVLASLAKLNNSMITGAAKPNSWDVNSPHLSQTPGNSPSTVSGPSIASILVGMVACFAPVFLFVIVIATLIARAGKKQSKRNW